jgi:hypothetical protein
MRFRLSGPARTLARRFFGIFISLVFAYGLVLAMSPLLAKGAPTSGTTYDPQSFGQELLRLKNELNPAKISTESLSGLRASLPKEWVVGDGTRNYKVSTDILESLLFNAELQSGKRREDQVKQAREYLQALAEETASYSEQPPHTPESARSRLQAILARPEFANYREPSWWDRLRARVDELLLRALETILSRIGGTKSLGSILLWAGVCGAAIFIAYWVFRRWFRAARMEEMALQAAAAPARSWQERIFAARDAAARGDYRTAVHCAYWAGISRLQDLGALSADRSKTPREYLRALGQPGLAGRPAAPGAALEADLASRRQALSTLTSLLEKYWYGFQTASDADFQNSLNHLETLGCRLP